MFKKQIDRIIEVYVDDMLIKSKRKVDHMVDLNNTFEVLRKYKMKLNPRKCAFSVSSKVFGPYCDIKRDRSLLKKILIEIESLKRL